MVALIIRCRSKNYLMPRLEQTIKRTIHRLMMRKKFIFASIPRRILCENIFQRCSFISCWNKPSCKVSKLLSTSKTIQDFWRDQTSVQSLPVNLAWMYIQKFWITTGTWNIRLTPCFMIVAVLTQKCWNSRLELLDLPNYFLFETNLAFSEIIASML